MNVAVTFELPLSVSVVGFVFPLSAPPHPAKTYCAAGSACTVSCVPQGLVEPEAGVMTPTPAAMLVVSVHIGTAVKVAVSVVSCVITKLAELIVPL